MAYVFVESSAMILKSSVVNYCLLKTQIDSVQTVKKQCKAHGFCQKPESAKAPIRGPHNDSSFAECPLNSVLIQANLECVLIPRCIAPTLASVVRV